MRRRITGGNLQSFRERNLITMSLNSKRNICLSNMRTKYVSEQQQVVPAIIPFTTLAGVDIRNRQNVIAPHCTREKLQESVPSVVRSLTPASHYMFAVASHCCCSSQLTHVHAQQVVPAIKRKTNYARQIRNSLCSTENLPPQ